MNACENCSNMANYNFGNFNLCDECINLEWYFRAIEQERPMNKERELLYKVSISDIQKLPSEIEDFDYNCTIYVTSPNGRITKFLAVNIFNHGLVIVPSNRKNILCRIRENKKYYWKLINNELIEMTQEESEAYWIAEKHLPKEMFRFRHFCCT